MRATNVHQHRKMSAAGKFLLLLNYYKLMSFCSESPLVSVEESKRFIKDCMLTVGTSSEAASALADLLVEADYRGHFSHGMNRLGLYFSHYNLLQKLQPTFRILHQRRKERFS